MFCTEPSDDREWATTNLDLLQMLRDESGSMLVSVLGASPDCIKLIELDGTLSFMNENGQTAMEIEDPKAICGLKWSSMWPEDTRRHVYDAVAAAIAGNAQRFEARCPTAKGNDRWWDVSVAPITAGDGKVSRLLSISRDVTHRVRQTEALQEREAELERLAWNRAQHLKQLRSQIFCEQPLKS
ncbi:MAG: PAS domain-containing protein [Pseudomonadota bacterium]